MSNRGNRIDRWRWSLAALIAGGLAASVAQGATGRTVGETSVSSMGEAQYTIPIWTPPGPRGLRPQLALDYSSSREDDLAGMGFTLTGLSAITRCNKTIAQDGVAGGVALSTSDALCLDGNRLRLTSGTQGAANSTYRSEIESFRWVTAQSSAGNGPAWFEVKDKGGLIFEYGNSADSRIEAAGVATVREWALNRIRDRNGNAIEFSYTEDTSTPGFNSYRLSEVRWTSNTNLGVQPAYKLAVFYESVDRPDTLWGQPHDGSPTALDGKIREAKRIDRIDITYTPAGGSATLVRRYELTYEAAGGAGNRSRLQSLQECGGSAGTDCLAATTFTWTNSSAGWGSENTTTGAASVPLLPMDINGDGRDDLVYPSAGASSVWTYMLANASGGFGTPTGTPVSSGASSVNAFPIEWNGDGRMDLIAPLSTNTWGALQANGSGFNAVTNTGISSVGKFWFADVDGNGRDDMIRAVGANCSIDTSSTQIFVRLNTGAAFGAETLVTTLTGCPTSIGFGGPHFKTHSSKRRPDFDGDGREDYLISTDQVIPDVPGSPHVLSTVLIRGSGASGTVFAGATGEWRFGDFNGDGLTDLANYSGTGLAVRYNTGGSLGSPTTVTLGSNFSPGTGMLFDWNNDGLDDYLVLNTSTSTLWVARAQRSGSFAAPIETGASIGTSSPVVGDSNGDSLNDLLYAVNAGGSIRYRLHSGVRPDLLDRVTDGYEIVSDFDYAPLTDATVYTKTSGAIYPTVEYQGAKHVVKRYAFSNGTGSSSTITYTYTGARLHLQGRGFLGFAKRIATDSRNNLRSEESYLQNPAEYQSIGLPNLIQVKQGSGALLQETTLTWNKLTYSSGSAERRFPFVSQQIIKRYEAGGAFNGSLISTATTTNTADPTSGVIYDSSTTTVEAATANGVQAGANYTQRTYHPLANLVNDVTNWCLGRPGQTQLINSHTQFGGGAVTRTVNRSWDPVKCRPTQEVVEPASTQWKMTTDLVYDDVAGQADPDFGNLTQVTVTGVGMSARTSRQSFGSTGQFPVSFTNALSQTTQMGWDASRGVQTSQTDPNTLTTAWQYDNFGRRTREDRPDGTATTWSYNACASVSGGCTNANNKMAIIASQRDTANAVIRDELTYTDQLDRPITSSARTLSGAYNRIDQEYDALGRLDRQTAPCWWTSCTRYWSDYTYDILNRPTQLARPVSEADATLQTTSTFYEGLTTRVVDAQSKQTTEVANVVGGPARSSDHNGYYQGFDVDGFGNVVRVTDSAGNTLQSSTYNVRGMQTAQTDMDRGAWTYTPNAMGELTSYRDAKGQSFTAQFDALSRPLTRTEPGQATTFVWGASAASHNIGRLQNLSTSGYSEAYAYDAKGRLATRTITSDAAYTYTLNYQALTGLLDTVTYPTSTASFRLPVQYGYQNGLLQQVKEAVLGTVYWRADATNPRGQVTQQTLGNGIATTRSLDAVTGWASRLQSGVGAAVQNESYLFDRVGNLTQRQNNTQGLTENFFYDNLYRLQSTQLNSVTTLSVNYDALGNITSRSDVSAGASWTYDAVKKHAVRSAGAGHSYSYDANGNMVSRDGATLGWTSANLLSQVTAGGASAQFFYDPNRQRYRQVTSDASGTETTQFIGKLLERTTRSDGTTDWRHTVYAQGSPVAIVSRTSTGVNSVRYLLTDHLGSPAVITDSAGQVMVRESFGAFGAGRDPATWSGSPSSSDQATIAAVSRRGFTFHTMLASLNLIHMNGRVQDSITGRFLSADPFIPPPLNTQSFNRYSYVLNNPLSFTDPSGFGRRGHTQKPATTEGGTAVAFTVFVAGTRLDHNSEMAAYSVALNNSLRHMLQGMSQADLKGLAAEEALQEVVVTAAKKEKKKEKEEETQGEQTPCNDSLINLGNTLAGASEKAGDASSAVVLAGAGVAAVGATLGPEGAGPGLTMMEAGGALGMGAGAAQIGAGLLQGFGGGGFDNAWHGAMTLAGGYGLKLLFRAPSVAGYRTVSQRASDELQNRSATVVGGTYDALTSFISSLGPHQTSCQRH